MRKRLTVLLSVVVVIALSITVGVKVSNAKINSENQTTTNTATKSETTKENNSSLSQTSTSSQQVQASNSKDQKLVAFTFDDGPSKYTKVLIDEFNSRGIKATFFMLGVNAQKYPDTIKYMLDSGNELGCHTYDHLRIRDISNQEFLNQMEKTDKVILEACGKKPTVFRPPYGAYTNEKLNLTDKTIILWSIDTLDWKTQNPTSIKNEILKNVKDGSIVLMHDIFDTSVQGALMAADELQAQGYQFVTVSELLAREGKTVEAHKTYSNGAIS